MNKILNQNKNSWNKVAHHFDGKDALPSYGPFTQTEDELNLFGEIQNKRVLDIGFGSGHSLLYMANKGAIELWGIDLSESQKEAAEKTLVGFQPKLYCAPMEEDIGLPKAYFDIVYSIYAIGWTTDLPKTFQLIHSYLKKGGTFIFSWDHPLYAHLKSENGRFYLDSSYQEEGLKVFENFKEEGTTMSVYKRKLATYINDLIQAGFSIEAVIESDVKREWKEVDAEVSERYYSLYKAKMFPSTMVIKARKL
ncbi:class I SAM-dependent methyltransferase [Salirhabdus sp. Marseille-P4669]|uniref:class I SAM-dependent methyltransferase n=1 Tax=Salirhabdus sp. Marseille-P4669 TaxID=2042310 RepID=UPI000C7C9AC5|nr:class I SAM-dependent methyltransferase [Salirhabdus sp. Marseille-P4669]